MPNQNLPESPRAVTVDNPGPSSYLGVALAAKLSAFEPSRELILETANRLDHVCDLWGDDNETLAQHIDQLSRSPVERVRRVFLPKKKLMVPKKYQSGFEAIRKDIEAGNDLTKWLSAKINHDYTDKLLNHWDIHHFHFVPNTIRVRGPERAYCFIDRDEVYFLTVSDKGDWDNPELIEIAHENFRDRMRQFEVNGVVLPETKTTNVSDAHENKHNVFIKVNDGTIYCPPSFGITTSGIKISSMRLADIIKNDIAQGRLARRGEAASTRRKKVFVTKKPVIFIGDQHV